MTDREIEEAVWEAMRRCFAEDERCDGCPLNSEANDASCVLYAMSIARRPDEYEVRDGVAEPVR